MNPTRFALLASLSLLISGAVCHAGKGTDLKPILVKPGKAILDEKFDAKELGESWAASKGDWQIKNGTVTGKEKAEDKHAAVLTLNQPNRDSIIRFSFKADGATGFNLSFNRAKGHLFRVVINPDGLTITKDKDKKDPASKPEALAKASGSFPAGQWHTLQVEIQGGRVLVQSDNGVKLDATHAALDVDKPGYRFVMRGETLLLDDLKIWQVAR